MKDIFKDREFLEKYREKPLFEFMNIKGVHRDLISGYPYIDNRVDLNYIEKSTEYALKIFNDLNMDKDIILIYEDIYGLNNKVVFEFIKNHIDIDWENKEDINWQDEDDYYNLVRYIFKGRILDINNLFKEIIKSDIGGKYNLSSAIYILDYKNNILFNLYDDRGIYIFKERNFN